MHRSEHACVGVNMRGAEHACMGMRPKPDEDAHYFGGAMCTYACAPMHVYLHELVVVGPFCLAYFEGRAVECVGDLRHCIGACA